jgi:hypothetical protein
MVYGLFLVIYEVYLQIWYRYLTDVLKSSTLSAKGASIHHVNKGVEVEHNETSFDYRSLRYTINKRETDYQ